MSDTSNLTPQLELQMLQPDNSAHHLFDRAIMQLDGLIFASVEDRITAPPGSETDGQLWLVDGVGIGAWTGHNNELALYYESFDPSPPSEDPHTPWFFFIPYNGMRVWIKDENIYMTRKSGAWFTGAIIANPTDEASLITAINGIITALEGHGLLDV